MHVPGLVWRAYFSFKSGMEIPKNREVLIALNPVYKYLYWNKDAPVSTLFPFYREFLFCPWFPFSLFLLFHFQQSTWLSLMRRPDTKKNTHTQPCIRARVLGNWYNRVPYPRSRLALVEVRYIKVGATD